MIKCLHNFLSYIEIWENVGDLKSPNYQGTILNNPEDYHFLGKPFGEIIRINDDQCSTSNALMPELTIPTITATPQIPEN